MFYPGGGGEGEGERLGGRSANRRKAASSWEVIQGGGEQDTRHIQQIRFIRNTFPLTLGFGSKVTVVTQESQHLRIPRPPLPLTHVFFPSNVQQRPTTIISDFLIHRFIPIHFIHCLLAAICVYNLYGYGLIHPSFFPGSFYHFYHSFF